MEIRSPDFYLASPDGYDLDEPRQAYIVRMLSTPQGTSLMHVRIRPPILYSISGSPIENLDEVLIAAKHQGVDLRHIEKWPVDVYVARLTTPEKIAAGEFTIIAWAQLYLSDAEARDSVRRVRGY